MKRFAYLICVLIITTVFLEIVLRITGVFLTYPERLSGQYVSQYDSESLTLPQLQPNTTYPSVSGEFNYESKINSIGFREREIPMEKGDGEKRIIFIGDSFVQGIGTPNDSTWTRLLEQEIIQSLSDSNYIVYSGGISGSDPIYGYEIFKNSLLQLNPDIVVVCFNHTDFNEYLVRGGFERFDKNGNINFTSPIKYEEAYKRFHVVRFYTHVLLRRDHSFYGKKERREKLNKCLADYVELIKLYEILGDENNFKSYPLIYPLPSDIQVKIALDIDYLFSEMNTLKERFQEENMPLIDIFDCLHGQFKDENSLNAHYHKIDRHYNSKGYQVLANCTFEALLKSLQSE